jgi:MFS family permease
MTSPHSHVYPPLALACTVWGLGAALYLIGFFQRVAPAVLTRELSTEFALTAAALGNLSAVYFYSYVAMQIPTGLLADHWGPRRTLAVGGVVAALGAVLFGLADTYTMVALGRLLVGGAVGVAFVSMLKLSTHWFHPARFATVTGVAVATGVIGAVSAGAPLRFAADAFGWRHVIVASGVLTALVAVATWLVVRDDPRTRGYTVTCRSAAARPALGAGRPARLHRRAIRGSCSSSVARWRRASFAGWGRAVPDDALRPVTAAAGITSLCSLRGARRPGPRRARTAWASASRSTSSVPRPRSSAGSW